MPAAWSSGRRSGVWAASFEESPAWPSLICLLYTSCDVLDIFRTGDQTADRPHGALPVRQDNFVKCRTVTLLRAPDQLEVYQHSTPLAAAGPVLDFASIGVKTYP